MSRDWTAEQIARQTDAAKFLLEELASDDAELNHDMIEGETNFFEAIEAALDEVSSCDIIVEGCKSKEKQIADRRLRASKRKDRLRGMIEQAFSVAEIKAHTFPTATVTIKSTPPQCVIEDEAALPSKYFAPQPPKLDKSALAKDVKAGEEITGARLTNGSTTIQIKWS